MATLAEEAAQEEAAAFELDASGRSTEALRHYKNAVAILTQAQNLCPIWHQDKQTLISHIC